MSALLLLSFVCVPSASAALPPQLGQFDEFGVGAGQTTAVTAIAANPVTGHLYLGEQGGARVSEFTAWGEFVRSWGWGVEDGSAELQVCTAATGCQEAIRGDKPGQFEWANGIAVAPDGDVYVFDRPNLRVQKFDSAGNFLLMFGGEVNKTTSADVCTAAQVEAGDECGAGTEGTGDGEFGIGFVQGVGRNYISAAPDGSVYVGDQNRIQVFEPSGAFKAQIPLPVAGNPGALAVDPLSGDVYFAYNQGINQETDTPDVFRLDQSGAVVDVLPAAIPDALATDADGNVFVLDRRSFGSPHPEVLQYGPDGEPIIAAGSAFTSLPPSQIEKIKQSAIATNVVTAAGGVDLYAAYTDGSNTEFVRIFGPPPDKWPPPAKPPSIEAQFAGSVGAEDAVVRAEINPLFWADTTYHVEYGTAPCSGGGCTRVPASGELPLDSGVVNQAKITDPVELAGLAPNTTYHFRFTAQSSGGGPVVGGDATFTTFPPADAPEPCANSAFRQGAGAFLPQCRAYEMVSPVDKEGGEVLGICNNSCFQARLDQAAVSGDRVTYSSYRAFPGSVSAPWANQYLASRGSSGWSTDLLSPPQEGLTKGPTNLALDNQFKGFLDDLSAGWFVTVTEPQLTPSAVPGFANLYRRTTSSGAYEAATTAQPPETQPADFIPELQGFSSDGSHLVFRANGALTAGAATGVNYQLYEYSGGALSLVSVLPGGTPASSGASAGTGGNPDGRSSSVHNAVSDDGLVIYWSELGGNKLYVRLGGVETRSVSLGSAQFWGAAADGARAIFTEGQNLVEYDLGAGARTVLATQVLGVMGMSTDASRVYFASTASLAAGATAGKPNLYLREAGGSTQFLATLASADLSENAAYPAGLSPMASAPFKRTSRVSPDGLHAVFMSRAPLTGADNTDQASGEADAQVFLFDAEGAGALRCVSCNPTGARPSGKPLRIRNFNSNYWAAGHIPTWESQLHASRVLSADGDRVFFMSFDRLTPRDENGVGDVYEWARLGTGSCSAARTDYNADSGGCVALISDGTTPRDSELIDASTDGRDVFFTTSASLVSADPALTDLYDARVGGGFANPPAPPVECEGEACQAPAEAPAQALPGSTAANAGNPKFKPTKTPRCSRGKHRVKAKNGKVRCAKNKKAAKRGKSRQAGEHR